MSKNPWKALALSLVAAIVSLVLLISGSFSTQKTAAQITSVSQLSDVQPSDYAYLALQNLVERYGIDVEYIGDRTFRGNRVLRRGDMANWINEIFDRLNELIGASSVETADISTETDIASLQRRVEFLQEKVRFIQQAKTK